MLTTKFYEIIDTAILGLIEKYKNDEHIKKQVNDINNQKSYAFLIWFLQQYGKKGENYKEFITEGGGDSSCDIIFDMNDPNNNKIYYVIQSKWKSKENINESATKEIKLAISDFEIILNGKKEETNNKKFNEKYKELLDHKRNNGTIKFILLTLSNGNNSAKETIDIFEDKFRLISFTVIGINRLKIDYIDEVYKQLIKDNPLDSSYLPLEKIKVDFVSKKNIEINSPYKSYVFLVKPKFVYEIFEKYRFRLFFQNIRNPLIESEFNKQIELTLKTDPSNFWYFNNGITAITRIGFDEIYPDADNITVNGLQIINGAQTVFSIYKAYKESNDFDRESMNKHALITFKIFYAGGSKQFETKVTRFTNSQNPVTDRDFYSNDEEQVRIQNEFFENTNIWFEKRRGEFRKPIYKKDGVEIIPNDIFAKNYIAYFLQNPLSAKSNDKYIFVSKADDKEGLYEYIFNSKTDYLSLLIPYYIYSFVEQKINQYKKELKVLVKKDNSNYSPAEIKLIHRKYLVYSNFTLVALFKLFEKDFKNDKEYISKLRIDFEKKTFILYEKYYTSLTTKLDLFFKNKIEKDRLFNENNFFKLSSTYSDLKNIF